MFAAFWEDLSALFRDTPDQEPTAGRTGCGINSSWPTMIPLLAAVPSISSSSAIRSEAWPADFGSRRGCPRLGTAHGAGRQPFRGLLSFSPWRRNRTHAGSRRRLRCAAPRGPASHPWFGARRLWRIGTIEAPVDQASLGDLRGLHLLWLREQTGAAGYAADTDGDLL